jgi:hypothetical protein
MKNGALSSARMLSSITVNLEKLVMKSAVRSMLKLLSGVRRNSSSQ